MDLVEVSAAETDALVKAYRAAAKDHGDAGQALAANRSAKIIAIIFSELRRRGIDHQSQLLPLLLDISPSVRLWSAAHALEFAPSQGEPVLERLSACNEAAGLSAKVTLTEWRAGRLRFPEN